MFLKYHTQLLRLYTILNYFTYSMINPTYQSNTILTCFRSLHAYPTSRIRLYSSKKVIHDKKVLDNLIIAKGKVTTGYGRGSKKLGFPTANLPYFDKQLDQYNISNGVYYGWTTITEDHLKIYPCVANIGKSPTFVGQENSVRIIETHIISSEPLSDFYEKDMNLCLVGFIRPEMKFNNLQDLIIQITNDINYTKDICLLSQTYNDNKNEHSSQIQTLSTLYNQFITPYLHDVTNIQRLDNIKQLPILSNIMFNTMATITNSNTKITNSNTKINSNNDIPEDVVKTSSSEITMITNQPFLGVISINNILNT